MQQEKGETSSSSFSAEEEASSSKQTPANPTPSMSRRSHISDNLLRRKRRRLRNPLFKSEASEDSPHSLVPSMVLVFYKPPADPDPTSVLSVLMLPSKVSIPDVLRYRKKLDENERYIEMSPYCKLQPQQEYTLSTCPENDSVLVEPTTAEFNFDHHDNHLPSFQVALEKTMTHLKLFLRDAKSSNSVWERQVCLSSLENHSPCEQSALNLPPNQRLLWIQSRFIKEVSEPVLKSLLDKLLEKRMMTDSEVESADQIRYRENKARFVVETVMMKGEAASSEMIEALWELDPIFLCDVAWQERHQKRLTSDVKSSSSSPHIDDLIGSKPLFLPSLSPPLSFYSGEAGSVHAQKKSDRGLLGSSGAQYTSTAGYNYSSRQLKGRSFLRLVRQGKRRKPWTAKHPLPADTHMTSFISCDSDFSSNSKPSDSIPGPQDHSSDPQNSSSVTEGSRAQAERSSVHSEAESGGDIDAEVELEAAVTAVSCSVTNTLPSEIQTCSSGPSWTKGLSGSHSCPSLSHMTSAEDQTLTRAQSLPDLQLNSSCEQFTPDITADEDHETYRFQCSSPGLYQCSVTGLVFHMEGEGDMVYKTVPWNRKLLSQRHKQPAGPLFDIKCEQQNVCQLHLPHCEIRSTGGADFLSVAHFDEEGMEFIVPHKITETHVIINITGFSAFGNVKDEDSPPDPVRALVLVFYKPPADPDPSSLLNVMLLPRNVAFRDVLHYRKKLDGNERYVETSPYCKLQPQQDYTLSTCPEDDSVPVEPTTAEFDSDNYDNYFPSFQVTLEKTMTHLKLFLRDAKGSNSVWEKRVCLSSSGAQKSCGQSALNRPPNQKLCKIRLGFIEGISEPNLKSLMDKLLDKMVMTGPEVDSTNYMRERRDKARFVIDTVERKNKGSKMIDALRELDPALSENLGLNEAE
ncbi:uncharacterized protein LOC141807825 [Halichoeres trimaculatus]|uniref:uncharacterized protein LOC141807825 n=1 Tax=Halichoeres trimaculatus TaxID=147232 RepID=UPI003D9E67F9